jgi:XTP/dITP diphosphohydrolase
MISLVIASRNKHKIEEMRYFLRAIPVEVMTLQDFPQIPDLVEDGLTFVENALSKARQVFDQTGKLSLADDSGLEVFFLNGRPGVRSARYAGAGATDGSNNVKLLDEMSGVAPRRRAAQFRSVLALVGKGMQRTTEGICTGKLAEYPRGTNGFGYDPIFVPDGFSRTYAELVIGEKNRISHRSKAFLRMVEVLNLELRA